MDPAPYVTRSRLHLHLIDKQLPSALSLSKRLGRVLSGDASGSSIGNAEHGANSPAFNAFEFTALTDCWSMAAEEWETAIVAAWNANANSNANSIANSIPNTNANTNSIVNTNTNTNDVNSDASTFDPAQKAARKQLVAEMEHRWEKARHQAWSLIQLGGRRVGFPRSTMATAMIFLHRFYEQRPFVEHSTLVFKLSVFILVYFKLIRRLKLQFFKFLGHGFDVLVCGVKGGGDGEKV
jgi:hypothetical protein